VPGQLTSGWRVATMAAWVLVLVAWTGVWKASRELGIATWWLGPPGQPRALPVLLVPFMAPLLMVALTLNNARRLPWLGLSAAAVAAAVGIVDLSYVRRLGYVEVVVAIAAAAVSIASRTGMYARVTDVPPVSRADVGAAR
jgi:hypothetical protein